MFEDWVLRLNEDLQDSIFYTVPIILFFLFGGGSLANLVFSCVFESVGVREATVTCRSLAATEQTVIETEKDLRESPDVFTL